MVDDNEVATVRSRRALVEDQPGSVPWSSIRAYLLSRVIVTSLTAAAALVLAWLWDWQSGWPIGLTAIAMALDGSLRLHRRARGALLLVLLFDVTVVVLAVQLGEIRLAVLLAPHAYALTAAIMVLRRRDGIIIAAYIAVWWLAVAFGTFDGAVPNLTAAQEQIVLGLSALFYLGSMFVMVSMAAAGVRERESLSERLSSSRTQLRAVVSGAPVVLFSIDKDGVFTLSEGAGLALLGLEPGQVVGLSVWDVYADYPAILDFVTSTLAGEETEGLVVDLPGASFQMRVSPQRDASGEVVSIIGIGLDVTDQIAAEQKLAQMQSADQLLASMSTQVLAFSGGDELQSIMLQFGRVAEYIGCEKAYIVSLGQREEGQAQIWTRAVDDQSGGVVESQFLRLPWLEKEVCKWGLVAIGHSDKLPEDAVAERAFCAATGLMSLLAIPMNPGPCTGYALLGTATPMREWNSNEAMMLRRGAGMISNVLVRFRAQQRLEDLVRSKDQFVASVSHELRTPLSSVLGLAEILRDDAAAFSTTEVGEFHTTLAEEAAELAAIVEDLLVIARADIDAVSVVAESVDLDDEVQFAVESMRKPDRSRIEWTGSGLECWCDRSRLRQVLRNLLTNALRYGGPDIELRARQEEDRCIVDVCDNGEGISDADAARIFEPYEQAGSAPGRPGSIGLGLTVSRKLCRLMGGDLAYLREGRTNVFRVTLPSTRVAVVPQVGSASGQDRSQA